MPGPSWPNNSRHSRGNAVCSRRAAPGTLSTATTVKPAPAANSSSPVVLSWWHNR
ncbi:Uncharacterised protein [Mycobacterium tuberculosis]|nr:Uncharacterised protein [Mycobacterium tuberculosis]COY42510.1 Uncharacterised protein [Mycobacterium tuberculosis]